jgi:hypothetical protein
MQKAQRLDSKTVHREGHPGNQGDIAEIGDVGIVDVLVSSVDVLEDPVQFLPDLRFGMDRNRALHQRVVPTHLVESEHMIDMRMRHQDRVATLDSLAQGLLSMIGRNVDEDHPRQPRRIGEAQTRPAAQTTVTWILRGAGVTVTADHRNAG